MERTVFLSILILLVLHHASAKFKVNTKELTVILNSQEDFNLILTEKLPTVVNVTFDVQHSDLVKINPVTFNIPANDTRSQWNISVSALSPGKSTISANVTPENITDVSDAFVRVTVARSIALYHISRVVGWIYFLAWSISFYPQIYTNWKRRSVVGLNFDFLSLNAVGFLMYSLFNCGLYWIPEVELEYYRRYPKGLNPVQVNDIFFAIHAMCATVFTIGQCFVYETGTQRVSTTARFIHGFFTIFIIISIFLGIFHVVTWLDFLYFCSYIKLAITLIKYVPQAYYNYKRQSTVGWSIGNIFLDFTGGILSMLQMILNAYNYDDWDSIFGDPTKFGLGFFSVSFDVFFIFQHYVLYRVRADFYDANAISKLEDMAKRIWFLQYRHVINLKAVGEKKYWTLEVRSVHKYRMKIRIAKLLDVLQFNLLPARQYNCWTAAITKKHRKIYERTYPTVLVYSNGSTINFKYSLPLKIVTLPLDISTLSEAERKAIIDGRKPKSKIKLEDEIEIEEFNTSRYINLMRR